MPPWLWATQTSSRIGGHGLLREHHPEQDLPHHRTVPMGNQEPIPGADEREQRFRGGVGNRLLLLGGAADVLRMRGVAADGDEERVRDRHAQPPRYAASAASTAAPRGSLYFSWERTVSSAPRVFNTASGRAL